MMISRPPRRLGHDDRKTTNRCELALRICEALGGALILDVLYAALPDVQESEGASGARHARHRFPQARMYDERLPRPLSRIKPHQTELLSRRPNPILRNRALLPAKAGVLRAIFHRLTEGSHGRIRFAKSPGG
jgi:hypothetical protein